MIRDLAQWALSVRHRMSGPSPSVGVRAPERVVVRTASLPVRDGGRNTEADKARLLAVLTEAFVRSRSRIEDADRTAMTEVTDGEGKVMTRVLTLGEVAEAIVAAGWRPPGARP